MSDSVSKNLGKVIQVDEESIRCVWRCQHNMLIYRGIFGEIKASRPNKQGFEGQTSVDNIVFPLFYMEPSNLRPANPALSPLETLRRLAILEPLYHPRTLEPFFLAASHPSMAFFRSLPPP
jgi:hypothetical protein